jgi:hypothetical protein
MLLIVAGNPLLVYVVELVTPNAVFSVVFLTATLVVPPAVV